MYFYEIGNIGFGFDIGQKLLENSYFGKFAVSEERFNSLNDRHFYTFSSRCHNFEDYKLIFSGESASYYLTEDNGYVKKTVRSDGVEFGYVCEYSDINTGGNISFFGHNGENLKTTGELFRIIDFVSALLRFDAFILHASCVDFNGSALLFSGESGCGKSTQAGLWNKYKNCKILNGDRVLIRRSDGILYACGIPFCGSSAECELFYLPIKAVVFLGKSINNTVSSASAIQTLLTLSGQITCGVRKGHDTDRLISLTDLFCRNTEIVKFDCLPDESAVKCLEAYLN